MQEDQPHRAGNRGALVARISVTLSTVGLLAAGAGPIAVHAGVAPFLGFNIFLSGLLLGLLGFLLGAVALWLTRGTKGIERSRSSIGTSLGLLLVIVLVVAAFPGFSVPRINDITTDFDDPPAFAAAARESANQGRNLSYPESFAAEQREGYPDIKPIRLPQVPPADAFVRAQRAAGELGWKSIYSDPVAGIFEAQEVSPTFLFVDDIVVRVRPEAEGSRIDVRSKSRYGKGDLGMNAKRIRAFAQSVAAGK